MPWSHRLFYPIAMVLAAAPPLLSSRFARQAPAPNIEIDRAGLTLAEERGRHVIVTSLRNGGPADRSGMAVGDELRDIAGQPVTGITMARQLINDPKHCDVAVDLHRDGLSHVARINQCDKKYGMKG